MRFVVELFVGGAKLQATPFIDLGPVLFFDIKLFGAGFRVCSL